MSNTNTPKTRLEWFAMFPEPYKSQAIENYDEGYNGLNGQTLFDNAVAALGYGFSWHDSPQDYGYWASFQVEIACNEITLTAPEEEVKPDYEAIVKELVEWLENCKTTNNNTIDELIERGNELDAEKCCVAIEFIESTLFFIKSKTEL